MKHYLILLILVGASLSAFGQTCTTFPCVVASVSLTNQTQPLPSTPIFTPTNSGIFRISAYLSTSKTNNPFASWTVSLGWTDDIGPRQSGPKAFQNASTAGIGTFVVQSLGGQPLFFRTRSDSGASGSLRYNLFIVVEQLE